MTRNWVDLIDSDLVKKSDYVIPPKVMLNVSCFDFNFWVIDLILSSINSIFSENSSS